MLIYNIKTISHTPNGVDTGASTTCVFENSEKSEVFNLVDKLGATRRYGIIEDFNVKTIHYELMSINDITKDMPFKEFAKMIHIILKEHENGSNDLDSCQNEKQDGDPIAKNERGNNGSFDQMLAYAAIRKAQQYNQSNDKFIITENENGNTVVKLDEIVLGNMENIPMTDIKKRILDAVGARFDRYIKDNMYK